MNIQGLEGMERQQDSEVIELNCSEENEEESFGDLEDDNAIIEEEPGQRIVIDEDTMQSNDLLLDPATPAADKPPSPASSSPSPSPHPQPPSPSSSRDAFYKGLVSKLEESSYNDQTLQPSYAHFELEERRYLEQVKIVYCHFLLADKPLSPQQFQQLRALLFVPSYGLSLVRWGNKKYEHSLTLSLALERLDHMERLAVQPKRRCFEELRLLVMLVLLLIVIKLLS